jgi:hypothetical protein
MKTRELKGFLKRRDEFVEIPRANRIETRCRFIEKDNLGIEGKGTPPVQRAWSCRPTAPKDISRPHPDSTLTLDFEHRQFLERFVRQVQRFAHRRQDVFLHSQR